MFTPLDPRDRRILDARKASLDGQPGPRVGDYVVFSDGVTRRISYNWGDAVQTSDGGSWYLGDGYCSFSGSLYSSVPIASLTQLPEERDGSAWFFHHDYPAAHNGVDVEIPFRVYSCTEIAP